MAVVDEFNELCRLCGTKTGILMGLPIFGDRMQNIEKKIAACLPVQVSKYKKKNLLLFFYIKALNLLF